MNRKIGLLTSVCCSTLFVQACAFVGAGWLGETRVEVKNPPANIPAAFQGGKEKYPAAAPLDANKPQATTAELEKLWGPPKTFSCLDDEREIWSYREDETRWSGIVLGLLVPLPFLLPTGSEGVDFHIENGNVTKANVRVYGGGGCMLAASMSALDGSWHNEGGCEWGYSWSWRDWASKKVEQKWAAQPTACQPRAPSGLRKHRTNGLRAY
jgi:hypothetical protein